MSSKVELNQEKAVPIVRAVISELAKDVDDEWLLLDMLGLV